MAISKTVLKKLGKLKEIKRILHNEWVESNYEERNYLKYKLIAKVMKQLEEKARRKLKSDIPYEAMADYLIENFDRYPYMDLHQELMLIVFQRNRKE